MFLCETHLNIIVMSEMRYDCSSETSKDFYFESIKKHFCTGCLRHFCNNFTFSCPSVDFRLIDFCVNSVNGL